MTLQEEIIETVWKQVKAIAIDAAPGSLTPRTVCRIVVDITLRELQKKDCLTALIEVNQEHTED